VKHHLVKGRPHKRVLGRALRPDEVHRTAKLHRLTGREIELHRLVQAGPDRGTRTGFGLLRPGLIGDLDGKPAIVRRTIERFAVIGDDRRIAAAARDLEPAALIETPAILRDDHDQMRARQDIELNRRAAHMNQRDPTEVHLIPAEEEVGGRSERNDLPHGGERVLIEMIDQIDRFAGDDTAAPGR
jgi:hypothetical protein